MSIIAVVIFTSGNFCHAEEAQVPDNFYLSVPNRDILDSSKATFSLLAEQSGSSRESGSNASGGSKEERSGFFKRLFKAYLEGFKETPGGEPEPARRGLPAPLKSPPFPSSDWLGSPLIGAPDTTPDYPLMKALLGGKFGQAIKDSRIKVYGWVNASGNLSTSKDSNFPLSYDIVPNSIQLNQFVLRAERQPDTVQTDHRDWGFRISNFYGIDYRFTTAKGFFSDQLLKDNNLYGYDAPELYGLLYIPGVAEGLVLKVGRFISPPDIEAQLAPDNYLHTHSLMFTVDPYTFTGVQAMVRLNIQWQISLAVHAGNDMMPWSDSAQPNGHLMVRWVSKDNNDSIWAGVNSIGSGKFRNGHDNLQHIVGTWGHRFTDRVHMMTELYYMWQYDAAKGGSCNNGPVRSFGGGGGCGPIIPGQSSSVGGVNYFQVLLSKNDYLSVRTDFLNDIDGQRTGYKTLMTSNTIGWAHYFSPLMLIRPELRYDRAWDAPTYDNGKRVDQTTLSADLIVRY